VARIAFVAREEVWHLASAGMPAGDPLLPHESLCARAVQRPEPVLVYEDLRHSAEPAPPVMQQRGVTFYAGALLRTRKGHALGTLCVAGSEPRTFNAEEQEALSCLAELVATALEKRRQLKLHAGAEAWTEVRARAEEALAEQMLLVRYLKARAPEQVPVPQPVLDMVKIRLAAVAKVLH
jgi:GAF domain-containing protein